ncbi:hypothetical protein L1987_33568 [Smallanthus sonchifolius]|uniref:Uncharacterized protein n=1 Tax=Smallanthus sonchifolius TaxID=185202 RepID=A0ACB9HTZ8_9ASTR|nr:hypothetical protein L1987_33568 [Smallanthus sonchifolius]
MSSTGNSHFVWGMSLLHSMLQNSVEDVGEHSHSVCMLDASMDNHRDSNPIKDNLDIGMMEEPPYWLEEFERKLLGSSFLSADDDDYSLIDSSPKSRPPRKRNRALIDSSSLRRMKTPILGMFRGDRLLEYLNSVIFGPVPAVREAFGKSSGGTRRTNQEVGLKATPLRYARSGRLVSRGFIIPPVLNLHSGGVDSHLIYLVKAIRQLMCNHDRNAIRCTRGRTKLNIRMKEAAHLYNRETGLGRAVTLKCDFHRLIDMLGAREDYK